MKPIHPIKPRHSLPLPEHNLHAAFADAPAGNKLRDELLAREIFYTLKEAQVLVKQWREYNHIRPHSSLGYRPPVPETMEPRLALMPA